MGERAVVLVFWPITYGWRACWGRKEISVVSSAFCKNSLCMEKRFSVIPTVSQQHPRDCSAAASDTWLCWKFCHVHVPQKMTLFSSPQRCFRVLQAQNLALYDCHRWLPDLGQHLTSYPHTDFLILLKFKNLLYVIGNFPAVEWIINHWIDSAADFNHGQLWQQQCASHRKFKFLSLNPLAEMLSSYITTNVQKSSWKVYV